jgi:hypothetical protein
VWLAGEPVKYLKERSHCTFVDIGAGKGELLFSLLGPASVAPPGSKSTYS